MKLKFLVSWLLVCLCACFIFFMSSMDNNESNAKSKTIINGIIKKSVKTTNGLGITDEHPSKCKMNQIIDKLNYPLRKVAHASEYFILTTLILAALKNCEMSKTQMFVTALIICFIYACIDEYHQTFVNGRTGQFSDALIDTFGGIISCLMYNFIIKINRIKKKNHQFKAL